MAEPMDQSEDDGSFLSDDDEGEDAEWALFFPGQPFSQGHSAYPLVAQFRDFLDAYGSEVRRRDRHVYVAYALLVRGLSAAFLEALRTEPALAYPAMELALYRHYKAALRARPQLAFAADDCRVCARIVEWPVTGLKHLKAHCIGTLLSVSGTVIRASGIRPRVTFVAFRCPKCGTSMPQVLEEGKYVPPTACATAGCRSKRFELELDKAVSCDWQTIRVQENVQGSAESGRVPRTIEIELLGDLADSCVPGDTVTVTGVIKREALDKAVVQRKKNKAVYYIYMEARTVVNTKQPMGGVARGVTSSDEYDAAELLALQKIAKSDNVFLNIVNSLCPSIYGHELVKAGLCLALFGGTQQKVSEGGTRVRGDPHVLVVGDPGLGKSQMLRAIANVAPRGIYVCGSYSSSTGLTVSLVRDPQTGDNVLEAGALVLADQGMCCIDEFDKMPQQHHALLEAMEQQNISVAKAGVVCTLNARTSVVAAANPAGGHYDRSKSVAENLKLSPAMLSRFDLVFILLDKPDEGIDKRLSEHVMAMHGNRAASQRGADAQGVLVWQQSQIRGASQQTSSEVGRSLLERLRVTDPSHFMAIPAKALRKYIAYARRYVAPVLSDAASTVLQRFYLRIRREHTTRDSTPITNRQLESLIRLAEARARLELRQEVTEADAEEVVELMEECMFSSWEDSFGNIDVRRSTGMSKKRLKDVFVQHLLQLKQASSQALFSTATLRDLARDKGLLEQVGDFGAFLDEINQAGFITKAGFGMWECRA